jgi:cytochrome c-type biogenesis protein
MIPLYIGYLAGDVATEGSQKKRQWVNTVFFILGFTLFFVALGATATALGAYLSRHLATLNKIGGGLIILLSLGFLGAGFLPVLGNTYKLQFKNPRSLGVLSSLLFGLVFAIGWSPCTGPFLGSALMMAANAETVGKGMLSLFAYAMGLAVPFALSSLLLNQLESAFSFIKKHYVAVERISGILLLAMGIVMVLGYSPAMLF